MTQIYITGAPQGSGCCVWQAVKGCITIVIALITFAACCGASAAPLF